MAACLNTQGWEKVGGAGSVSNSSQVDKQQGPETTWGNEKARPRHYIKLTFYLMIKRITKNFRAKNGMLEKQLKRGKLFTQDKHPASTR